MMQQGQVSEHNVKSASARVAHDDLDGMVSADMQVLFPAIGGWNCFWVPEPGDHAVTAKLSNSNEGYVVGKVYTGNKMPQGGTPKTILLVSDNGKNVIRFNAEKGTLDLIVDQDTVIKTKNVNIEVIETAIIKTKNAEVTVEENATVEVGKEANITVETANIEATKEANINSPKVTIDSADVTITGGNFTMSGSVSPSTGPLCAIPNCLFTGAPHGGNKATGT